MSKKWSNLTAAIEEKAPIDWEAFGASAHRVKMVSEYGKIKTEITRDHPTPANTLWGWETADNNLSFSIFHHAWEGRNGWELWVEDEIPLLPESEPVTADTLPLGACFLDTDRRLGFVFEDGYDDLLVSFPYAGVFQDADKTKVQQVYSIGTFKPTGQETDE